MLRFTFLAVCAIVLGCANTEKQVSTLPNPPVQSSAAIAPVDSTAIVDTTKTETAALVLSDSGSPRLMIDSAAKEPRMELRGGEFIVHLPLDMARVLADSLPDFTPIKRDAFDKGLVLWRDHYAENPYPPPLDPSDSDAIWKAALSVAVGDFNGDSKRDVAMEGISGDKFAAFFLLSAADPKSRPVLLYFSAPTKNTWSLTDRSFIFYFTLVRPGKIGGFAEEEGDTPVLDLKTDAIEFGIFEKASELYYIEKGVVQIFTTSD